MAPYLKRFICPNIVVGRNFQNKKLQKYKKKFKTYIDFFFAKFYVYGKTFFVLSPIIVFLNQ